MKNPTQKEVRSLDYLVHLADIWWNDFFYGPAQDGNTEPISKEKIRMMKKHFEEARSAIDKMYVPRKSRMTTPQKKGEG